MTETVQHRQEGEKDPYLSLTSREKKTFSFLTVKRQEGTGGAKTTSRICKMEKQLDVIGKNKKNLW